MSASFLFAAVPVCKATKERYGKLIEIVKGLSDEELTLCDDGEEQLEVLRENLLAAINDLQGFAENENVGEVRFEGMLYPVYLTGGLSWGDAPTEEARSMWTISGSDTVYEQLVEWAKADAAQGA